MRISTATQNDNAIRAITEQQTRLAKTQSQVASGKRVQTPADDPAAAAQILQLRRALAETEQHDRNTNTVINRLNFEEQAVSDASDVLNRAREIAVQAGGTVLGDVGRAAIATELGQRLEELIGIANRQDASGEYLFAGASVAVQPFASTATGVTYSGDGSSRRVEIGPRQFVVDGHSGGSVFVAIPSGNGTFRTTAVATNTGNGSIDSGTIFDPLAWQSGNYTIQFSSPTAYQVRDAVNTLVASGNYTAGGAIDFRGARVQIAGAPATGDRFTVAPAGIEDVFATLANLQAILAQPVTTSAAQGQLNTAISHALTQLSSGLDHLSSVRAEVGARLSALDTATNSRGALKVELSSTLSGLQDIDYAEAVARMNQQLAGLQVAQQTYAKVSQLSLFDYLR